MPRDPQALNEDIERLRRQLAGTPSDSPDRVRHLKELGDAYGLRYEASNDLADLDAAIMFLRDAVAAMPPGHPERGRVLRTLGDRFRARFERTGDPADGEAADSYHREAAAEATDAAEPAAPPEPAPPPSAPGLPDVGGLPPRAREADESPFEFPNIERSARPPRESAPPPAPGPRPPTPAPGARPFPSVPPPPVYGAPRGKRRAAPAPSTEPSPGERRLEFAAAYQRDVERGRSYPFLFVVHRPGDRDLVRALIERRAPQLGGTPVVSHGEAVREIRTGTRLSIVPNVIGATFEPSRIEVVAGDAMRELAFRVTVPHETAPGPLDGYVDIFVGPLIIAQVPVAFEARTADALPTPTLAPGTKLLQIANASIFDKIFISYSHRDSAVVDLCVLTYQGLGVTVLLDRIDLHSGDDWRAELTRMIQDADIFQLYWSTAAAASSEVRHEWRLALGLSKARDHVAESPGRPGNFIRPLYWQTPLPPIPEQLRHLHFSRVDLKQLRKAAKAYATEPGVLRRALAALGLR